MVVFMNAPCSIDDFYIDRKEISTILKKRVDAFSRGYRQNVALVGQSNVGKTILIEKFISAFSYPDIIPVYVDVVSEPFDYFVKKFMGAVLHSYLSFRGVGVPENFDALIKKAKQYLPVTMKAMRAISREIKRNNNEKAFALLLSLTTVLGDETGKKVLVIFDEFDRFQHFDLEDPLDSFSQEIMVQKDTMYFVTSSNPDDAKRIFREKLSLLFGNFESLDVHAFCFAESAEFIDLRLRPIDIDKSYEKLLIMLTDGQPYFLDLLVTEIKRLSLYREISVTKEVMIDAFTHLVFSPHGAIYQHFMIVLALFNKGDQFNFYLNILLAITCGRKKLSDISCFVEKENAEVKKALQRFIEEGLVDKTGNFFHVKDRLLKFWLKYVFHPRFVSLGLSFRSTELKFRADFSQLIDMALQEEQKEISKRVEDLLRSFKNDVIEINSKRIKCPSFNEVYQRPANGRIYPIHAKGQKTRWLCQVANKPVEEEDIYSLVTDCRKLNNRVNKKILITPHGISLNAKLMAKQEKITIWNLRNLNFVFDLYDKPKVIV